MRSTKVTLKDKDNNPINVLYLSAKQLIDMMKQSVSTAGGNPNSQITLPVWIDSEPKMLITIESGPQTEADYAIFKAQKE
jgi:hypothetical protein